MTANYLWFEVKTKRDIITVEGTTKTITEPYLVDASNFTDAECSIHEHLKHDPGFIVSHIRTKKLSEVIPDKTDEGAWFECRVQYTILDMEKCKEKKTYLNYLVQGEDTEKATQSLNEFMKGSTSDWSLVKIAETKIIDVVTPDPF
jgi:hypothetical protein